MFERVCSGTPPVTGAEFTALADWLQAREDRVGHRPRSPGLLELGAAGGHRWPTRATGWRWADGTVVPADGAPGPCPACGQVPEILVEVVETVVEGPVDG
jgi:hypothetical protein